MTTKTRNGAARLGATVIGTAIMLGSAFVGGAAAASAPSAITGGVTAYGPTTATVTGTVNPNGEATTWYVEYGKTTTYGARTATTSAGSGTSNTAVTTTLSGLSPATTYHYRLVAGNGTGTSQGSDGIVTTSAAPAAVTAPATNLSTTSATLNGSVNPNGRATTWYFEYGTSTNYGTKTPTQSAGADLSAVAVSAPVSGLQTARLYHYRVVAASDAGTTRGADQTFTLVTAPTVTTSPASSVTSSSARLNGSVNPNGQATTWYFEYGTTTSYGTKTAVASAGSGTRSTNVAASVTGLSAATVYHFRLVAANASGPSFGADQAFGVAGPPVVQTGSAQSAGTTTATLAGSVNPNGRSTSWYFEYGTTTAYGSKTAARSAGSGFAGSIILAGVSNLAQGTTYHYRLVASSSAGTSTGGDVTFTTMTAITLATSTFQAVYGHFVTISGIVSNKQVGVRVTVLAEPLGATSFATLATVLTGAGGAWNYPVQPRISTTYEATSPEGTSASITLGVRPAVSLRVITKARFSSRVVAGTSFAGRYVQLQRLSSHGKWVTLTRTQLNRKSSAIFKATALPHGRSTIRIAMSVNQAGPGYLGGLSRTLVYHRR